MSEITALTLPVVITESAGGETWSVWCDHCARWHRHGPGNGHRVAHCPPGSPYSDGGYYITDARQARR